MQKKRTSGQDTVHKSSRSWLKVLIVLIGLGGAATIGGVAAVIGAYYYVAPGLPEAKTIREIPLQIPLRIYSRDGRLVSEIGERRRILVTYDDVPEHVVHAFIAAEDRRFFEHPGVDYIGVLRAVMQLVTTGDVQAGGSTLTQQLARDYFLTRERLFTRKIREAFLAWKIEQEFSKEQIMALFLNRMFFGQRAYGVAAAAQVYFNKPLQALNVAEAATLAGVLPAPSRYNPVRSAANAEVRRSYVLGRMLSLDYVDERQYEEAMAWPMESELYGTAVELEAGYVAEMVRREMLERYGEETYSAGYQVVTTLDSRQQRAANYALQNGLLEFTRRRGYRGPLASVDVPADLLQTPVPQWPVEILNELDRYAPGGLEVALVTAVNEDNTADIVFNNGITDVLPWKGMSWAKPFIDRETSGPAPESAADVLAAGDVVFVMPTEAGYWALGQAPEAQGALVSMDPGDGAITSLAGGFDFATSKFNRVTQTARQPGSAFKPFIYSAALEAGNTAATVVDDSPVVIRSSELEKDWRPLNYSGRFYGPTRLREALTRSMNLVSVRLLLYNTRIGNAIEHIRKFGFGDAALPRNGSLALGGGAASPLDMVQGYATLANGGFPVKPYVIDAIYGPEGETLHRADPVVACEACVATPDDAERLRARRATPDDLLYTSAEASEPEITVSPEEQSLLDMADRALSYRPDASEAPDVFAAINAVPRAIPVQNVYIVQDMMRDVIMRGTGRRARALGRTDLSGKTGTSNDRRDAWFGGFNSDLATIVWVGYDDDLPLGPGEEGSRTALPIWVEYSRIALDGLPNHEMPMPEGIVTQKINRETGCPARAGETNTMFEVFRVGSVPECEDVEELPSVFDSIEEDPIDGEEEEEEPESLF